jgi:hypothetical protein
MPRRAPTPRVGALVPRAHDARPSRRKRGRVGFHRPAVYLPPAVPAWEDAIPLSLAMKCSRFSDGAIVGYRYARICWEPDGTVRDLVTDEQGDDWVQCPDGSLPRRVLPGQGPTRRP